MDRLALLVATFGFVGFFPIAPGTAGSLAALALYMPLRWWGGDGLQAAAIAAVFAAGVWAATRAERVLGRSDPGPVVIDEVLGMLITLAFVPLSVAGAAAGFVLFRVMDVAKPFPAGRAERLAGGWGIMLDDAIAGLYAHAAVRLLVALVPGWMT
ncbi:MAG: phosphatidylglycerophosphatase A [Acidobacteriota bacterium]